jgi:hypothetical protein
MKKIILAGLLFPLFCAAQKDLQTAIVSKHNNIPVFIMSEPVKQYNIVGAVTNKFRTDTIQTEKPPITINDMINNLVNYANELSKKDKVDFDAIITTDGLSGSLIKFKPGTGSTDSTTVKQ